MTGPELSPPVDAVAEESAADEVDLVEDRLGDVLRRRLLQERADRERNAELRFDAVLQLERRQRVEADVGQRPVELDRRRRHLQHGGDLLAQELDDDRRPPLLFGGEDLRAQMLTAAVLVLAVADQAGDARNARQHRVGARQRRPAHVGIDDARAIAREQLAETCQRILDRDQADAGLRQEARDIGVMRKEAGFADRAPGDRQRRQPLRPAQLRQRLERTVGAGVVRLPHRAEVGCDRRIARRRSRADRRASARAGARRRAPSARTRGGCGRARAARPAHRR